MYQRTIQEAMFCISAALFYWNADDTWNRDISI